MLPPFNQRTIAGGEGCVFNPKTGFFEIKAFPVPFRETEVWGMFPWKCGTKENPTVIRWSARASNPDGQKAIYLGGGERYIRDGYWGIFVLYREDQPPALCFRTGVGQGAVKRIPLSFDLTKFHTFKIEWTNEPRATLYIARMTYPREFKKVAEFRENVPTYPIYPIAEVAMFKSPKTETILEWTPSLFISNTLEDYLGRFR